MEHTKQFIKDAIEGGWKQCENLRLAGGYAKYDVDDGNSWTIKEKTPIAEILLDPLAWQAVGKTRGWKDNWSKDDKEWTKLTYSELRKLFVKTRFTQFFEHVYEGKTIEQALKEIT